MANTPRSSKATRAGTDAPVPAEEAKRPLPRRVLRWAGRAIAAIGAAFLFLILLFAVVPPPTTLYMASESFRLGGVERDWVGGDQIAPVMFRSVVAAEDANFCLHWGFDLAEIRRAVEQGSNRGASTITQQVVKNVFLWHGRNWARKAMEAVMTPVVELVWTKRRVLVVYLNVAEFGEGIFGVEAAAQHYFGIPAAKLSPTQAARLAAVLPNPKERNPARPSGSLRKRAAAILDGAETIRVDGRAGCFEPAGSD
jgi:monofunctional biosynthetic peptidoglycan transglycosylase